ncbi:LysR family transcriptional regulator [Yinghuangia seranimata]|uniref:LysR family transcriptional regulator n=1 Tax=Yinghuangia seranimata TaxID=408067 RepID=UPI00248D0B13|nr:LysR family transcriptional regulator [Yinghuangia seranimata]MDI2125818.1 LysR family transcriptional regulator [Yinghuangia seranimata]
MARVRAFAVTAELLHFGRAAASLGISQQALSKRVARLEDELGAALFVRGGPAVALTDAGLRLVEPAARALAAADAAVAAVRGSAARPVRLDVWGHLYAPMRTVAHVVDALTGVEFEPGSGRDLPSVAAALQRGDTDLGFGRVHSTPGTELTGLKHRLARLEPVDVVLSADHPLAGAGELRPSALADSVLWCPAAIERLDFLRRFAERFGIARWEAGANLGVEHSVDYVRANPHCFTLLPADSPVPDGRGVRSIPLVAPTPLYAWSLLWRDDHAHPELTLVLRMFAEQAAARRWLEYDPDHDWLPDVEPGGGDA